MLGFHKIMKNTKLYHDQLLDYYKHPRNKGHLAKPTGAATIFNPLCGDEVTVQLLIKNDTIIAAQFDGKGCVISLAAASLLTEQLIGKTVQELHTLTTQTMLDLVKIELGPTRLRCALLALEAAQKAGAKE